MRVLVIGGTLFIGREIVRRLVERGHDVTVLHRRDHHDLGPSVRNLQADRGDLTAMSRVLGAQRFEAVFDVAYDWTKGTTAAEVEHAARSCGSLQRYVFVSSIAAYPPGIDHLESDPLVPDDFPNPYAANKAASERALFRMHEQARFPVCTFRPPFVNGPRQPFYREQFFWDRLLDGRPVILPERADVPMEWVSVADLSEACVRAIEVDAAAGEAFNVAYAEHPTQREFVEILARIAGVTPTLVAIPRAEIQAAGGNAFAGILYFGEYLDLPAYTTVTEKARRILGLHPISFEEGFRASYAWYRTQPRRPADYGFEDGLLRHA
jgi:nucleoside-diphosphate-sugar epimerase